MRRHRVEPGEQRLLGVEALDDRLDDQVGLSAPRGCRRWRCGRSRPGLVGGTRPFSTAPSSIDLMNSRALSAAPVWASNSRTSAPPSTDTWAMPRPMAPVPTMPILKLPSWSVIAADAAPVCRSDFCCRGTVARPDGSFNPLVTTTGLRATEGACTRSAGAMYCLARLSLSWGRNVA